MPSPVGNHRGQGGLTLSYMTIGPYKLSIQTEICILLNLPHNFLGTCKGYIYLL